MIIRLRQKLRISFVIITIIMMVCSCKGEKPDNITSFLIKGLKLGDTKEEVKSTLSKLGISVAKSSMDGGEILVFLQNNSNSLELNQLIIDYVSSDKFSPEYPISEILPDIGIFNLHLPSSIRDSKINNKWEPSELYFYKDRFFAISSCVPSGDAKNSLTKFYSENKKPKNENKEPNSSEKKENISEDISIEMNEVHENEKTYMNINLVGNLYVYEKTSYEEVTDYIIDRLKHMLKD